jgi:hypothetical protein
VTAGPGIGELLGLAASVSLLAGWRLYLCVFATGIALRFGVMPVPEHLPALAALANPWVIGIAALGAAAEFFTDKLPWLDSLWDLLHTAIRPIGGAALALAIIDPSQPGWQAVVFLLGGGGALLAHGGKAGLRGAINMSPEPFTNVLASSVEDVATAGLLSLVYAFPVTAAGIAAILFGMVCALALTLRRAFHKAVPKRKPPDDPSGG